MKKEAIHFTKEQEEAIAHKGEQLLVKGIAGSGKTLVLLKSAANLAQENPQDKVAVFSFGKPLSQASESILRKYNLRNLHVITFHQWAYKAYTETFHKKPFYAKYARKNFRDAIAQLSSKYPTHRFFKTNDLHGFLDEEIQWIKGRNIQSKEEYLKAQRKGRGSKVRLSIKDREIAYEIYTLYEQKKGEQLDYNDSALRLIEVKDKIADSVKYDHIIIDEAQDLTKVNLELLVAISRKTCRIGADIGQKIYPTTFTWKETGLDFRGNRVKTLQKSFRSTKQIVELASSLQNKDEIVQDEEYTSPLIPTREGEKPSLFVCNNETAQDLAVIKYIQTLKNESPNASIGVLTRNWDTSLRLQKQLHAANVSFSEIGGSNQYKRTFQVPQGSHLEPGIKFTSFHTAKGLEFSYVVIVDLLNPPAQDLLGDEFDWDLERRLLYVAMTRAQYELVMFTYDEKAKLIQELDTELYEKIDV